MAIKNIAVLVSGGGTNLQALIDAEKNGIIKSGRICVVVSSKPGVYALERAEKAGIPNFVAEKAKFGDDTEAFGNEIKKYLNEYKADVIVLAGFLSKLSESLCEEYKDRILNVHPALIPSFCGKGFYGLHVHEAVLARGNKVTGATVHFVDEGTDTGPIILQKAVEVLPGDTPKELQQRVMEEAEWKILPQAINLISNGELK